MKILGKFLAVLGLSVLTVAFPVSLVASGVALVLGLVLYFKRKGQSPRIPHWVYWMFGISIITASGIWVWWIFPNIQRGRQIGCCANMTTITLYLEDYRSSPGDYPLRITEAIPPNSKLAYDGWDNPYHYEHRPGAFILASYGSDGKPDGMDYWDLRERNSFESIDGKFKADHLISDRGWHRSGGK